MKYVTIFLLLISLNLHANSYTSKDYATAACNSARNANLPRAASTCNYETPRNGHSGIVYYYFYIDQDHWGRNERRIFNISSSCENGTADSNGLCPEPVVCPDAGTIEENFHFYNKGSDGSLLISDNNTFSKDGCTVIKDPRASFECFDDPDTTIAQCGALITYTYTGEPVPNGQSTLDIDTDIPVKDKPETPPLKDGKHTEDNKTEVIGDVQTITLESGAKVETQTNITTEVKGSGVEIETRTDSIKTTRTDGIQKVITETTVTTTNADGSKSVKIDTNTAYTQHSQDIAVVTLPDGRLSISNVPSVTGSQTSTTTDTYDASGAKTGSETSTSNAGAGNGEDQETDKETCETNPNGLNCVEFNPSENVGSFDIAGMDVKIDAELTNLKSMLSSIKGEASQVFNFQFNASDTPTCIKLLEFNGVKEEICLGNYQGALSPIQSLMLFIGFFIALIIILR